MPTVGSRLVWSGSRSSTAMPTSRDGCRCGHWVERYSQVRLPWLVMVRSVIARSALLILRYASPSQAGIVNPYPDGRSRSMILARDWSAGLAGFRWLAGGLLVMVAAGNCLSFRQMAG